MPQFGTENLHSEKTGVFHVRLINWTIKKWNKNGPPQGGDYYNPSSVYAFLGDKKKAYHYLDEFSKRRIFALSWVIFLKHDPMFNGIRREQRFQKILKNVEAKYQAEHERVRKWLLAQGML